MKKEKVLSKENIKNKIYLDLISWAKGKRRIYGEDEIYWWLISDCDIINDLMPSNLEKDKIIGYNTALMDFIEYCQSKLTSLT